MNINKAIKKQKKSIKRFMFFMGFIFIILPIILLISNQINIISIIYLSIIEMVILLTIIKSIDDESLKFSYDQYKLTIYQGFISNKYVILSDKVLFVHMQNKGKDSKLIILTESKFRNKKIKEVNYNFLKKYSYVAENYYKFKKDKPENKYYYIIIEKGGYHKYRLLDELYKTSLQAVYSDTAIESIKEYRT